MPISARESLNKLDREISSCKKCLDLVKAGYQPVAGKGTSNANIMIVGNSPLISRSRDKNVSSLENMQNELMIKVFDRTGLSLTRDTYITSLIKCSPVELDESGGDFSTKEVKLQKKHADNCILYLTKEISIITPHIIVSMGLDVSNTILEKFFSIDNKYRDIKKIYMKIFENPSFKMVPFFDPLDVILKNTPDEEKFLKDFESLSKFLKMV
jgi:uracil-DNA glycosylase family 4